MTRRLYEEDSFCREFTATVLSCEKRGDAYAVVLDKTAFFPEGGGQPSDPGTLNGVAVLNVQTEGDVIVHTLAAPLTVGQTVSGALDWEVRFQRMQKHTGEHIVCGIVHNLYGLENVGFHLGSEDVTLDLDGELTREQLDEVESLANRVVIQNLAVTASFPSDEELKTLEYRSKKEIEGAVRIVTIDGLDRCACCAPHVAYTGQVGLIKLLDFIRYKGGVRIHMQCGKDALLDYRMRYTQTATLAAALSVKQHEVVAAVERVMAQRDELERELRAARLETQRMRVAALATHSAPVCFVEPPMDGEAQRELAALAAQKCGGLCAVFAGKDGDGYGYAAAGGDLAAFGARLKERLGARGGGNAERIQGRVAATTAEIEAFWREYASETDE
ncbi:MAG: alanyl-tRNA editing protein [Clostridia bacterium]|nr:alanyl-tRNA editing protein [Clostridia bacterium]